LSALFIIATFVLNHVGPVVRGVVTSAAFVLDGHASVCDAVLVRVEASSPEKMVVLVEDVLLSKGVLGELDITLEELTFTGASGVLCFESTSLGSITVSVSNKLADAGIAVGLADTLLAVLVGLALVVKSINWFAVSHIGHGSVAEHQTVAAVCPVLALVKLVLSGQTGLAEKFLSNRRQIIVPSLFLVVEIATLARTDRWASSNGGGVVVVRLWTVPFVIFHLLGEGGGNENGGEFHLYD